MRLLTSDQMLQASMDPALKKKHGVSDAALAKHVKDKVLMAAGQLASPSLDYEFVWDPATGERLLFRGQVDPL